MPPKEWRPCSEFFRAVTDPQAWDGAHQPVLSPWGNADIHCAFDRIDTSPR